MKKKGKITKTKVKRKKNAAKKSKKKKIASSKVKRRTTKKGQEKIAKPQRKRAEKTIVPAGASLEEIGAVTHYFSRVEAAVIKLTKGPLSIGDTIIIKGHTTDFKEKVGSIQLDHVPITEATIGQEVGLKVKSRVREHDVVYKLIS